MRGLNLLPWREIQREKKRKLFIFSIATAAFVSLIILGISHIILAYKIKIQHKKNLVLNHKIESYAEKTSEIKKINQRNIRFQKRIQLINQLAVNRSSLILAYNQLARIIPDDVFLKKLTINERKIVLEGYSDSSLSVATLMRTIKQSKYFLNPNLQEVKILENTTEYSYIFKLKLLLK